jgi:hypothetical protein
LREVNQERGSKKIDAFVNEEQKAHIFLYTSSKSRVNKIVIKPIEEKLRAGPKRLRV